MSESAIRRWSLAGTIGIFACILMLFVCMHQTQNSAAALDVDLLAIEVGIAFKGEPDSPLPLGKIKAEIHARQAVTQPVAANASTSPSAPSKTNPASATQVASHLQSQSGSQSQSQSESPAPPSLEKWRRADDEDKPSGVADGTEGGRGGQFNGSRHGFALTDSGDVYLRGVKRQLDSIWTYPEISVVEGQPVGCVRIEVSGMISETKLHEKSGNVTLDEAVMRTISDLQKLRNESPTPVPVESLTAVTSRWICFRFKV